MKWTLTDKKSRRIKKFTLTYWCHKWMTPYDMIVPECWKGQIQQRVEKIWFKMHKFSVTQTFDNVSFLVSKIWYKTTTYNNQCSFLQADISLLTITNANRNIIGLISAPESLVWKSLLKATFNSFNKGYRNVFVFAFLSNALSFILFPWTRKISLKPSSLGKVCDKSI